MTQNPFGEGGFDMNALMQQAQQMQEQLQQAQAQLTDARVEGTVAGGAVTVTVSGVGELVGVRLEVGGRHVAQEAHGVRQQLGEGVAGPLAGGAQRGVLAIDEGVLLAGVREHDAEVGAPERHGGREHPPSGENRNGQPAAGRAFRDPGHRVRRRGRRCRSARRRAHRGLFAGRIHRPDDRALPSQRAGLRVQLAGNRQYRVPDHL